MISEISKLRFAIVGIVLTLVLVPNLIASSTLYPVLAILLFLIMYMFFSNKKGSTIVAIAVVYCIPYIDSKAGLTITGPSTLLTYYRICLVMLLLCQLITNRCKFRYRTFLGLGILYASLYLLYGLDGSVDRLYYNAVHLLIYFVLPFVVCYNDHLTMDDVYKLSTVLFIITVAYAGLEFHHIYCPYSFIYEQTGMISIEDFFRAKGILGNPLMLCGIVVFYHGLCILRSLKTGKFNFFLLFLCYYTALITLSRSVLVIILLQWILYMVLSQSSRMKIGLVAFITITFFVGNFFFSDYIDELTERVVLGNQQIASGEDHRAATYTSVANMFVSNPLGVGQGHINRQITKYATRGLIRDFTLDNIYLRWIASFGLLALIPLFYHFYLLYLSYRKRFQMNFRFEAMLFVFGGWALLGTFYSVDAYPNLNAIYYSFVGYLFGFYDIINKTEFKHG